MKALQPQAPWGHRAISLQALAELGLEKGWALSPRLAEVAGVPRPLGPSDIKDALAHELWPVKDTAYYLAGYAPLPKRYLTPERVSPTLRELQRMIGDAVDTGSLASYCDGKKVRPMDVAAWAKTRGCCPAWLAGRIEKEGKDEFKPGMKKSAIAVAAALAEKAGNESTDDIDKWNTRALLQFIRKAAIEARVSLARGAPKRIAQILADQRREPIAERTLQEILLRVHSLDPTSE